MSTIKTIFTILEQKAELIAAIAAVVTCFLTARELNSSADAFKKVSELWMSTNRPVICIERHQRLDDDGINYNHEDCIVSNVGAAPRQFSCVDVKTYCAITFCGHNVPHAIKTIVVPVMYYGYGLRSQALTGTIYRCVGNNASKKIFEFNKKCRDFGKANEMAVNAEMIIVAHVGYKDSFGVENELYYQLKSITGHREISKDKYDGYEMEAKAVKPEGGQVDIDNIDLPSIFTKHVQNNGNDDE